MRYVSLSSELSRNQPTTKQNKNQGRYFQNDGHSILFSYTIQAHAHFAKVYSNAGGIPELGFRSDGNSSTAWLPHLVVLTDSLETFDETS